MHKIDRYAIEYRMSKEVEERSVASILYLPSFALSSFPDKIHQLRHRCLSNPPSRPRSTLEWVSPVWQQPSPLLSCTPRTDAPHSKRPSCSFVSWSITRIAQKAWRVQSVRWDMGLSHMGRRGRRDRQKGGCALRCSLYRWE